MHDAYNDDSESGVGVAQVWMPSNSRLPMMVPEGKRLHGFWYGGYELSRVLI